jgi:hypothetical protein
VFTAAEQALVNQLPTSAWGACQPRRADLEAGRSAVVNCRPRNSGTSKLPVIIQFTSQSAMNSWMATKGSYPASNSCAKGENRTTTWTHNGVTEGTLSCGYAASVGKYLISWSNTTNNIALQAEGSDPGALYTWWTKSAYVP